MQASISEVAEKAGVSTATVSRVLNGKAFDRIPEPTRARVRQAATELGYLPSRIARGLKSRRTMNIGVLVSGLRNPLFAEMLDTLEELILNAGYDILADTGRRLDNAEGVGLRDWPVDGVLMWAEPHQCFDRLQLRLPDGVPIVYLGYNRKDQADYVAHDIEQGTRLALDHLFHKGHRQIALVTSPDVEPAVGRRAAYVTFCREHAIEQFVIETALMSEEEKGKQCGMRQLGVEIGRVLAERPAAERPTAVFCKNDMIALGVMNTVMSMGLRVPDDLAVVGFDGIEEGKFHIRSLTTVETPTQQICSMAIEILLRRISQDLLDEPQQIVLPMSLRVGTTT